MCGASSTTPIRQALGEEVLVGVHGAYIWRLRIPFDNRESLRNYLAKLMRYERLLAAANTLSQLQEFVEGIITCREKRVPFPVYNDTNHGHVTTCEIVELSLERGVCKED